MIYKGNSIIFLSIEKSDELSHSYNSINATICLAVRVWQGIRPCPTRSCEHKFVLKDLGTTRGISWEFNHKVVSHPEAVMRFRWCGLVNAWWVFLKFFAVPNDWTEASTFRQFERWKLSILIANWNEWKSAWLSVVVRHENPSEVSSLVAQSLTINQAYFERFNLVCFQHLNLNFTVFWVVCIVEVGSWSMSVWNTSWKSANGRQNSSNSSS